MFNFKEKKKLEGLEDDSLYSLNDLQGEEIHFFLAALGKWVSSTGFGLVAQLEYAMTLGLPSSQSKESSSKN